MAKVDLESTFQMVPVYRDDWELLGMRWHDQFYVDTCLPFGLWSAPFLFNEVATALQQILTTMTSLTSYTNWTVFSWATCQDPPAVA